MITDFHSHILSEIDDGARNFSMSLKFLKIARRYGITDIVATPHFHPNHMQPDEFIKLRDKRIEGLLEREQGIRIHPGAEIMLCEGVESVEGLEQMTVGNGKYLLAELPLPRLTNQVCESIRLLWEKRGLRTVIAHIDRYPDEVFKQLMIYCPNSLFQINASALCRKQDISYYRSLIGIKRVIAIGSDVHQRKRELKVFRKAVQNIMLYDRIMEQDKVDLLSARYVMADKQIDDNEN